MKITLPFLFFFFLLLCTGCGKPKPKYDCYFPVTKFTGINVYTYVNKKDTNDQSHWHMKTTYNGKDTILKTTIVDAQDRVIEVLTEKISCGNSTMNSYDIYNYDSKGVSYTNSCEVIERDIYKANQKIGETIQWKVSFFNPNSQKCELTKVRTLREVNEKQRIFEDEFSLTIPVNAFIGKYSMESVYEKNKGLVKYTLHLPQGQVKEMVLTSIKTP